MRHLAFALAFCLAAPALAEEAPTEVKLGTAAPDDTPWSKQLSRLKERLGWGCLDTPDPWPKKGETPKCKAAGAKVKLKLYLNSVKGGEEAMVRQVAQGSLEMAGLSIGALAMLAPELENFELPYRFRNQEEADAVLDDPEVWALVSRILDKKGLVPYIWSENGWRNFATKRTPILAPGDLKGLKMRAQENRVHIKTYEALDAKPVPISMPETISALQTDVVDGFDNTPLIAFATSWYEGVKHWTVSNHIYQPALMLFNKAWLQGQPKAVQELLLSNRVAETAYGRHLIRKLNQPLLDNLKQAGIKIHQLDEAQRQAFAAKTEGVHGKNRALQSDEGKKLFDLIAAKLKAIRGGKR